MNRKKKREDVHTVKIIKRNSKYVWSYAKRRHNLQIILSYTEYKCREKTADSNN